jgi:DMSO/TMAO reductase YedYZ molybdopterin-dependent catalytic subunit
MRPDPARLAERYESPLHDTRVAARLGLALGVTFTVCFATGVWSHLAQEPPSWFTYPSRPAGLYRVTQGVHVASGMASIPLLLAKLWTVYPRFTEWPPVRSVLHGVERLALLPLVGGGLFLLFSGVANVARWYPWTFFFPRAHFWAAWLTIGALIVHIGAKAAATRDAFRRAPTVAPALIATAADGSTATARDRRTFLAGVAAAAGAVVVATAGGTFSALSRVSVLAQRIPGRGPQGLPVNKSAAGAGVDELARRPDYRLVVEGAVDHRLELSLDDLRALPQHEATLPIACVEGWSASARWRGVRVRDLLASAGARTGSTVAVESLQPTGRYRRSELNADQRDDADTLLALELDGEPLHIDHGYPVRLIGPNRPGVLQTKWVGRLVVA